MITWLVAAALAQSASEAEPEARSWWQPAPHGFVSLGVETLMLDRFWRSQGARGSLTLEVYPGLAVEVGGALFPLRGPSRLTQRLEDDLAAPLIADIGARGSTLGWVRPLVKEVDDWRTLFGVGVGVAGIVPSGEADWIGPVAGPAWAIASEAQWRRLTLRTRIEGAVYLAGFPDEQEILLQLPMWAGVDVGVRLF